MKVDVDVDVVKKVLLWIVLAFIPPLMVIEGVITKDIYLFGSTLELRQVAWKDSQILFLFGCFVWLSLELVLVLSISQWRKFRNVL